MSIVVLGDWRVGKRTVFDQYRKENSSIFEDSGLETFTINNVLSYDELSLQFGNKGFQKFIKGYNEFQFEINLLNPDNIHSELRKQKILLSEGEIIVCDKRIATNKNQYGQESNHILK